MNIAGFRKCLITLYIILLVHFTFYAVAVAQNIYISPAKKNSHPKISSYLQKLEKEYKEGIGAQRMVAQGLNISAHDADKATVYLMSEPGTSIDHGALESLGAQIIKQSDNVIKAKVPLDMLTAVADTVSGISFMKTPDKLIPVAVTSEGVDLTGADTYHNAGYTGSSVKVAVFDVGFIGLSDAISNNELPDNVVKVDCTVQPCNSNNPSIENTSNHGTAVAEIVHDMAPGATLYLIKVTDGMDLEDAKDFAVDPNNGIRIINMSLVVPNTNFYDGECYASNPVCTANDAYANNILWVNAAGNEAQRHYEAVFADPDDDGWHNVLGSDETIKISVDSNHTTINVYLTWDAWPTTNQNYDLYLLDNSLDPLNPFASSKNPAGGQPIEEIYIKNVPPGDYYLTIRQESASSNHLFEVYSIYHNLSPAVASSSLLGPADAAGAMAVGAINYKKWTTGPQELYSSQGPTNDGRPKPDIIGPDNVSTDIFISGFTGTSASSAHVAGAAALILNKNPGISVDDLWNTLTSTAIYMDYMEDPNIYGAGILNLDIGAAIPSSTTVTTSGGGGGGCFIATAAYGSYAAPCVRILREMRDRFLLTHSIGKSVISLYYKYSPPLADFIANHDSVKISVRLSLLPLVGFSWLALKLGPMFTITLMVLFVFGLIRLFSNKTFSNRKTI
jgi:subtilisin family serine protease